MNSSKFRRALRRHTQYKSPAELYACVLLFVGKPSEKQLRMNGPWWRSVVHRMDDLTPPHISLQAASRFVTWLTENYDDDPS